MTELDSDTYNRAHNIIVIAQRLGSDPVEQLHRAGLLMTPARERDLRVGAMQFLHREVVSWRPAEFLRMKFLPHHPASPADMYSCIVEFMERHIAEARKQ